MAKTKSEKSTVNVPAAMEDRFRALISLTDDFCREHLNEAYAELARKALAALCRKRPSPVTSGRADIWACAVVYALGQINFLSDRSQKPYLALEEVCRLFGVAPSTAGNKARQVRDFLSMHRFDHRWMLPDRLETFSPVWMVSVNGFIMDIRDLPRAVQEDAFRRGMIPYIPDDRKAPHPHQKKRDSFYETYARLRKINTEHQTELAKQLLKDGIVQPIAKRIGIMNEDGAILVDDDENDTFESLAPAFDLALYTPSPDGTNAIQRYAKERAALLTEKERKVLDAMGQAQFSVYCVERKHEIAGTWLSDMLNGGEVWLMDQGMEANGEPGMVFGMRLFRPGEFWMTTGLAVPTGLTIAGGKALELQMSASSDAGQLAEDMYRGFFGDKALH
jgi:hypothetical protein